jgi:ABC-2 type transport system permease protein
MMSKILALAVKDLRILVRLRMGLFFTFVWPLLVAIFFGLIFSGPGERTAKMHVAVVDNDNTAVSREFVSRLETSAEFETILTDRSQATSLVRQGKCSAAIEIPPGFGEASERVFYGQAPKLEVWIDPSRKAESAMIEGLLFKHAAARMQKLFSDRSASKAMLDQARKELKTAPESTNGKEAIGRYLGELDRFLHSVPSNETTGGGTAWQPLEIVEKQVTSDRKGPQPDNPFAITFPQGILWGILGCIMTFGIGIVSERTQGTMMRLQISPITRRQLLAGKALACFSAIAIVEAMLFVIGRFCFHVQPSSWLLLALAGFSTAVAFVGIMMLISVLGKSEQAVAGAGWAVMMPIAMFGGGMVPLFIMPGWMSTASNFSPAKWAILSLEGALWRGFSFSDLLLPCGILILVGVVCFSAGAHAFRSTA